MSRNHRRARRNIARAIASIRLSDDHVTMILLAILSMLMFAYIMYAGAILTYDISATM